MKHVVCRQHAFNQTYSFPSALADHNVSILLSPYCMNCLYYENGFPFEFIVYLMTNNKFECDCI